VPARYRTESTKPSHSSRKKNKEIPVAATVKPATTKTICLMAAGMPSLTASSTNTGNASTLEAITSGNNKASTLLGCPHVYTVLAKAKRVIDPAMNPKKRS